MTDPQQVARVARALEALTRDLDALEQAGRGLPAVEKNALRLKGTLRQLSVQFEDLYAVLS